MPSARAGGDGRTDFPAALEIFGADRPRRQDRTVIPIFEAVAGGSMLRMLRPSGTRNTQRNGLPTLKTYAFPVFGSRQVDEIESKDVLSVLSPIWNDKPETARRIKQRMKTVL